MFNRLAWLAIAALLIAGAQGNAKETNAGHPANAKLKTHAKSNPARQIHADVAQGLRPPSMDRLLAPDQFPTNVVKILRTTNKAQTNTYVPVVFTFKNNNPFNVIRFLHRPTQLEAGICFTFVNPEGTGGKVLFVVPDYMVPSLRELVATIDRPGLTTTSGDLRIYRQLRHRRAHESDSGFLETALSLTTGNGTTLIADPEENALFIQDAPSGAQNLDDALTQFLDVPTAMLELGIKIYELDASNDATIGNDYIAWKNGPGANLFSLGAYSERGEFSRRKNVAFDPLGTGARGLPGNNFSASGWNYAYQVDVPSAFFDFLAVKGKARVLSSMNLAALNTRPASMSAGDQLLYYSVSAADSSKGGVRDTGQIIPQTAERVTVGTTNQLVQQQDAQVLTPVETGLSLSVLPVIGDETIKLDLKLSWTDYKFPAAGGLPTLNPRTLSTTLRAKLGDEILIGGLERQVALNTSGKVPILGSLPLIGYLFGKETDQARKTEMVVVIHPTAVMNYNLAKDKPRDYQVSAEEQNVIDQASDVKGIHEPQPAYGFEMPLLDQEQ